MYTFFFIRKSVNFKIAQLQFFSYQLLHLIGKLNAKMNDIIQMCVLTYISNATFYGIKGKY